MRALCPGKARWNRTKSFSRPACLQAALSEASKGYLNEGLNTVVIKVAIGKNGDAIARFKTLASCPTNCTVTGINECTTLEARAQ